MLDNGQGSLIAAEMIEFTKRKGKRSIPKLLPGTEHPISLTIHTEDGNTYRKTTRTDEASNNNSFREMVSEVLAEVYASVHVEWQTKLQYAEDIQDTFFDHVTTDLQEFEEIIRKLLGRTIN